MVQYCGILCVVWTVMVCGGVVGSGWCGGVSVPCMRARA
jgi:hypothetical protein